MSGYLTGASPFYVEVGVSRQCYSFERDFTATHYSKLANFFRLLSD